MGASEPLFIIGSTMAHIGRLQACYQGTRAASPQDGRQSRAALRRIKLPEQYLEILRPEEAPPFFEQLDTDQRVVFAAAISSGLRKGELCGLLKEDLDVPRRLLVARHSYAQPFPKSKKQRVVRVPEEFVPF